MNNAQVRKEDAKILILIVTVDVGITVPKAIIDLQTASIFKQNPTFASKTLQLIYSKAFQTILLLFTCISAQYQLSYKLFGTAFLYGTARV
ncbi:hypothetical protein [Nostoc sp. UIC 10630]|uniref:hypothetical protein n=1 Tax=Nostoc sp. UIC 10630 TaxID=2100146 RepID=UPI0013D4DE9C|nr:hypothetical protein [Nostoc sp. UIC 10630]NEU84535.1 hypothetical protein [Nostoc sp. UIC 10630]